MSLVIIVAVGIVGIEMLRRSQTFVGKLRIALVFLLLISLIVAGSPA